MSKLPKILVAGEIKIEYLISASGNIVVDQPGGNLLYSAAGASLWCDSHEDIGLSAIIGSNFPLSDLAVYSIAYMIASLPFIIFSQVGSYLFLPKLLRIQNEYNKFLDTYSKLLELSAIISLS